MRGAYRSIDAAVQNVQIQLQASGPKDREHALGLSVALSQILSDAVELDQPVYACMNYDAVDAGPIL
jgi:hypothetical protein